MAKNSKPIYTFQTSYHSGRETRHISARVFIDNLPPNSTATVKRTVKYSCSWFIFYSVVYGDGRTKFFYEQIEDSGKSSDYVLNISYGSTRAICSFDSTDRLTFVSGDNEVSVKQDYQVYYEYPFTYQGDNANEYKIFLVIFRNKIFFFWHDNCANVIVKTLDLSSFDSFEDLDFTRVNKDIELSDDFSLTLYTEPSCYNTYYSLYLSSKSIFDSNDANYVLKEHRFNIPCDLSLSGSQFIPDTDNEIRRGVLKMDCLVDGELQEAGSEAGSEDDSEAGSEAGSYYSEDDC